VIRRILGSRRTVLLLIATLAAGFIIVGRKAKVSAAAVQAPMFQVDALWPRPLPNHWILGSAIGVSVDSQDHIWIVHRQGSLEKMETYAQQTPPGSDCCVAAPPVLEFDEDGNLNINGTGALTATGRTIPTRAPIRPARLSTSNFGARFTARFSPMTTYSTPATA
jgi:lipid-binding SYLF domain-containing protein